MQNLRRKIDGNCYQMPISCQRLGFRIVAISRMQLLSCSLFVVGYVCNIFICEAFRGPNLLI